MCLAPEKVICQYGKTGRHGRGLQLPCSRWPELSRVQDTSLACLTPKEGHLISQKAWCLPGKNQTPYSSSFRKPFLKYFNLHIELVSPLSTVGLSLQSSEISETNREKHSWTNNKDNQRWPSHRLKPWGPVTSNVDLGFWNKSCI